MPKVSVLIPVYNTSKYLEECLDSIVNQTLKDIEIICINDGSTDNSLEILEKYAANDNRIKIINKENSGYGASMNRGLDIATGEYIGIVESDDFVKKEMFEKLYNLASENNLDMVKADFYYYFAKEKQARRAGKIKKSITNKICSVKDDVMMLKIMPSIWSAIYKKGFLSENDIRFLETPGASFQDTSFAFKTLSMAKRLMFADRAYLYYRQDNANSSVKSNSKPYAICDEWEEITSYINNRPDIKAIVNDVKLSTQFNAYRWNALRIDSTYKEEFIERYQKTFKTYLENGEIKKGFYKKADKREFELLLNNKEEFKKLIVKLEVRRRQKALRRKNFSIRINPSRISIVLFGRSVLEIG